MRTRFLFVILAIFAGISVSCGKSESPSIPGTDPVLKSANWDFARVGDNLMVLGMWRVFIDPLNGKVEATELRSADMHFNVTTLVKPPKCYNCFLVKNLIYDSVNKVVTVDVGFKNPANVTGYDVRGIITDFGVMELLNPDGFTELFSLTPGKINPLVAYKTGVGQRQFPAYSFYYETLRIYQPTFPTWTAFTYVVEASYPTNCKEPYEVEFLDVSGKLYTDGSNTRLLRVYARDWQNDINTVKVDLTPIGGGIVELVPEGTIPELWQGEISCAAGTSVGSYDLEITASSLPPFDQTSLMYNYCSVNVGLPPQGTVPEEFGTAEQVSHTDSQSFVWPRHAVAVTSNGAIHAVWVDNFPNPDSNQYHVYYSKRVTSSWTAPQMIDGPDGYANYVTVAAGASDSVNVVWEDSRDHVLGSDLYFASSTDSFASTPIIATGDDGYRNVQPHMEADSDGSLHVAWHSLSVVSPDIFEYDVRYMKKQFGSPTWDAPVQVAAEKDVKESYPAVIPGPGGSAYIAFQSDKTGINGIYFTDNIGGSFKTPTVVTLGDSYQPTLDITPDGVLLLAYFDYVSKPFSDVYVRFSGNGGASWGSPMIVSDPDAVKHQVAPDIEASVDGDVHVAWHEEDDSGHPWRIFYREYLNGAGWEDPIEISGPGGIGAFPSMDSDLNGHIHMIYEQWTLVDPPGQDNYEIWYRSSVP